MIVFSAFEGFEVHLSVSFPKDTSLRRTLTWKLFYLALLLPVSLACNLAGVVKKAVDESQKPTTLTSSDLKTQLTLPGGWREDKQLNDIAVLEAANSFQEMYIVVLRESRQDFGEGATLDDFAAWSREGMMGEVLEPQATDPLAMQVGNYPAMEYRLDGTVDKIKIRYICTTVETPNHYYQIISWTLPSRFEQNQATLRGVTQSFRELDAGAPPPPAPSQ